MEATKVTYSSIVVFQIRSNHIDSIAAILVHLKTISRKNKSLSYKKVEHRQTIFFLRRIGGLSAACLFLGSYVTGQNCLMSILKLVFIQCNL